MSSKTNRRQSRVPAGRLERMARFGLLTGELVIGGLAEGAKRFASSGPAGLASAFLSTDNARRLARRLSHMRGAAMKLGQLLSLEGEDLLPREFAEALAVLRAAADTMPISQVRRILGREYGKGWEARFDEFDFEPIAAASIGQVHYARAKNGRELALKIQYPGIARSINSDVDNVALLLQLARILPLDLDVSGLVGEAKRQLRQEADYVQEANFLRRYRRLVTDEPRLQVPKVHEDLTTQRILAMDFVDAYPLEHLGEEGTSQGPRDTAGQLLEQLLFRELFEFGFMQTDPNFANYLFEPDEGQIVLLDFGSAREFSPAFVNRYTRICRAIVSGDRAAIQAGAVDIGYLQPNDSEDQARGVVDLILLVCEPLRHTGIYDFARSKLAARARDAGFDLAFRRGYRRAPPPETVFLHRKLIGSFLLCARIRARVDVQSLILPFLEKP